MRSLGLLLTAASLAYGAEDAAQHEYFEKKVRPVLVARCMPCHSAKMKTAGLDLETGAGVLPGRVLNVVGYEERVKMPPSGKLKSDELAAISEWVKGGGAWPGTAVEVVGSGTRQHGKGISAEERKFWAFQPVQDPAVPPVKNAQWALSPIDRFILSKLEAKGLKPAVPA